ncbi:hypothetical protein HK405_008362 [Cladochytrium tenue]|nr:hypothetical protein HK405_008362 [Cladochytrium tenue]
MATRRRVFATRGASLLAPQDDPATPATALPASTPTPLPPQSAAASARAAPPAPEAPLPASTSSGDEATAAEYCATSPVARAAGLTPAACKAFVETARARFAGHAMMPSMVDKDLWRFLAAQYGNATVALQQVGETLDWRASLRWDTIATDDYADLDAEGKLVILGDGGRGMARDGSTLVVWRHALHQAKRTAPARSLRYLVHRLEAAQRRGWIRDRVTVLVDRIGMNSANHDAGLARAVLAAFAARYPDRVSRLVVFPRSAVLSVGWKVARGFLDETARARVRIVAERDVKRVLREYVEPAHLPRRYGGELEVAAVEGAGAGGGGDWDVLAVPLTVEGASKPRRRLGPPPPRSSSFQPQPPPPGEGEAENDEDDDEEEEITDPVAEAEAEAEAEATASALAILRVGGGSDSVALPLTQVTEVSSPTAGVPPPETHKTEEGEMAVASTPGTADGQAVKHSAA